MRPAMRTAGVVAALTAAAAALRFATLGERGFWEDEGFTVLLLRHSFGGALATIPVTERTPPLYYVLAWPWARLFGFGEAGVRSLPALFGTATVPIVYLAAKESVSARVGIAAAALVAANPLLIWISQDARSYSLLALLVAASLLFLTRAMNRRPRALLWWSLVSTAAVATHYFAAFIVAAEALWLVRARGREALAALAPVAIAMAALLPLLIAQEGRHNQSNWIHDIALGARLVEVPGVPFVALELQAPEIYVAGFAGGALALVALVLIARRGDRRERAAIRVLVPLTLVSIAAPLALAIGGIDYFYFRNLTGVVVPGLIVLAVGFGARRAGRTGPVAAAALCALWVAIVVGTAGLPKYDREDWRGAARSLGPAAWSRAVVVTPAEGLAPMCVYLAAPRCPVHAGPVPRPTGARVREVDVVALAWHRQPLQRPTVPRPRSIVPPAPGFRLVARHFAANYTTLRFVAARPVALGPASLVRTRIESRTTVVLVQPAGSGS